MSNERIKITSIFEPRKDCKDGHPLEDCSKTDSSLDGWYLYILDGYKEVLSDNNVDEATIEYLVDSISDDSICAVDILDYIGYTDYTNTATEEMIHECGGIAPFKVKYGIEDDSSSLLEDNDVTELLKGEEDQNIVSDDGYEEYTYEFKNTQEEEKKELDEEPLKEESIKEEQTEITDEPSTNLENEEENLLDEDEEEYNEHPLLEEVDSLLGEEKEVPIEPVVNNNVSSNVVNQLQEVVNKVSKDNDKILAILKELLTLSVGEERAQEIMEPFSDNEEFTEQELLDSLEMVKDKTPFPESLANLYISLFKEGYVKEVSGTLCDYIDSCIELGVEF